MHSISRSVMAFKNSETNVCLMYGIFSDTVIVINRLFYFMLRYKDNLSSTIENVCAIRIRN